MMKKLFYLILILLPFNLRYVFNFSQIEKIEGFREHLTHSFFLFDVAFILLLFLFLAKNIRSIFEYIKSKKKFFDPLLFFVLLVLVSIWFSSDQTISFFVSLRIFEAIVFFLIAKKLLRKKEVFKDAIWFLMFGGVFQSIIAVVQFVCQKSIGLSFLGESVISPDALGVAKFEIAGEKMIRAYGTFPHPNLLAVFLLFSLAGGFWLFFYDRDKNKNSVKNIFVSASLAVIMFGMFLTYSRSVLGATAIFLIVQMIFWRKLFVKNCKVVLGNLRVPFLLRGAICIAIVFSSLFLVYNILMPRMCLSHCYNDNSVGLRSRYVFVANKMIVQNPFLGVGPGNFSEYSKKEFAGFFESWEFHPVHNLYLLIAAETGLVSLGVFAFFIFVWMCVCVKMEGIKKSFKNPFFLLFSLLLLLGLVDHYFWTLPQGQMIFWLSLAFLKKQGQE